MKTSTYDHTLLHECCSRSVVASKSFAGHAQDLFTKGEIVWLIQDQMTNLFGKAKSIINEHIKNIFKESELNEESVTRKFGISEFTTQPKNFYNLNVIISVGACIQRRDVKLVFCRATASKISLFHLSLYLDRG